MEYDKKDLLAALKEGEGYDYIADHYWEMSKEDLKDVALELIWLIQDEMGDKVSAFDPAIDELKDRWGIEEGE